MTQGGNLLTFFSPLYSNGAILVYDITDEDSFFKVTHSAVLVTIKVTCTILFYYIDVNCVLQELPTLRRAIIYSCDVTIWHLTLLSKWPPLHFEI